jgi:LysM repeat protein
LGLLLVRPLPATGLRDKMQRRFNPFLLLAAVVTLLLLGSVIAALFLVLDDEPAEVPTAVAQAAVPTSSATATGHPTTTPLPSPSATSKTAALPLPNVTETTTATPTQPLFHVVALGETLTSIAAQYGIGTAEIMAANNLADEDVIWEGQELLIPLAGSNGQTAAAATPPLAATRAISAPVTATATVTLGNWAPPPEPTWAPSLTAGDLESNYPLTWRAGEVIVHYQPGTYPADIIEALAPRINDIYAGLQIDMGGDLTQPVDVYLAGTLFAGNPGLQGLTQSRDYRTFVLVNGVFHPGERDYILGHELSHVAATNILGAASSTMIHEGIATYLPQRYLTDGAGYLSLTQICAAAYRTGAFRSATQLSQLAYGPDAFGGHIRTFFHYNLAGCFVGYLVETYGMAALDQVYETGDYAGVYGLSLAELDASWQAQLAQVPLQTDAPAFVDRANEVAAAYESYLAYAGSGYHPNYEAYIHLNQARLAVNQGRLETAATELALFRDLWGG